MYRFQVMLRSLAVSLGLYAAAALIAGYFLWHGANGQRGQKIGLEYDQRLAQLRLERDLLKLERLQWERRISLMRGETVDADALDEEAHATLGKVNKNEVVIFTQVAKTLDATR